MATVAVVGAGPAGCAAAIALGHAGVTVHLFERGAPHKDKACGDALLPAAVRELDVLGIAAHHGHPRARSFDRVDLWDNHREIWTVPVTEGIGWAVPRAVLDQALRDSAGRTAEVRYRTPVRSIFRGDSRWAVTTADGAAAYDAVILATGATNAFSRQHGISGHPTVGASVSVYARCDGVEAPRFQFAPLGVAGYGWLFPLADGEVNIGVCAVDSRHASLQRALTDYLARWAVAALSGPRGGAGPFWSGRGARWHDPRGLVSCGDAAGLVDPLTGEGVGPALESGRQAGAAVASFLQDGANQALLEAYSAWLASTFRARYQMTTARRMWAYLNRASAAQ